MTKPHLPSERIRLMTEGTARRTTSRAVRSARQPLLCAKVNVYGSEPVPRVGELSPRGAAQHALVDRSAGSRES
jgi:hypothetical protein